MEKRIILGLFLCALLVWVVAWRSGPRTPSKGELPPAVRDVWRGLDSRFEDRYLELGQAHLSIGLPGGATRYAIDGLEVQRSESETLYVVYYEQDGEPVPLSFRYIPADDEIRLYETPHIPWKRERVLREQEAERRQAEREEAARQLERQLDRQLNDAIFGEDPYPIVEDAP